MVELADMLIIIIYVQYINIIHGKEALLISNKDVTET